MRRASHLISVLAFLAVCAIEAQAAEATLIKSGTILTVTQGTIEMETS